jgi:hypothetical protein
MKTLFPVYVCEDFKIDGSILTIWDAKLIAQVDSIENYKEVHKILMDNTPLPNAIICPGLSEELIVLFK